MQWYTERAKQIKETTKADTRLQSYDVEELFQDVVESNRDVLEDVRLSVTIPKDAELLANHMIHEAFGELLNNAVKHTDTKAPKIDVDVERVGDKTVVDISDCGPGMPAEEYEALGPTATDQIRHLSGMGLWFVYWTIEHSDVDIQIESDDAGTTVRLAFRRPSAN